MGACGGPLLCQVSSVSYHTLEIESVIAPEAWVHLVGRANPKDLLSLPPSSGMIATCQHTTLYLDAGGLSLGPACVGGRHANNSCPPSLILEFILEVFARIHHSCTSKKNKTHDNLSYGMNKLGKEWQSPKLFKT